MNCILCSKSTLLEYSQDSYLNLPVYHCSNCDLYITGNSETELKAKLKENYEESQWVGRDHYEIMLQSNYTDIESLGKKRQWTSQYAYCMSFLKNKKKLLEVGTGAGQALCWFEETGFSVTGIEPDKRSVELINHKLRHGHCIAGFAEDIQLHEKFDVIWMSHVLEHLIRPDLFLQRSKNNLENDGIIFIEVPNCGNKEVLYSSIHEPSTFHFSKDALQKLGEKSGYEVVQCDFFRSPTIFEGIINKIVKKYFRFMNDKLYLYYPKVVTDNKKGTDIRIILKINEN